MATAQDHASNGTPRIAEALESLSVPLSGLNLDGANVRKHDARNVAAIKASLTRFGQRLPIVVQREGMIVRAGNGRVEAARALGWTELAAVIVDEGDVEATAFAIADNRSSDLAEWDDEGLAATLKALAADDVDIGELGFSDAELAALLLDYGEVSPGDQPAMDETKTKRCPHCDGVL